MHLSTLKVRLIAIKRTF